MKKLGEQLKKMRLAKSLSQKDVAVFLGYSSSQFVSNWERNLCRPPGSALRGLSKLFSVNYKDLVNSFVAHYKAELMKNE